MPKSFIECWLVLFIGILLFGYSSPSQAQVRVLEMLYQSCDDLPDKICNGPLEPGPCKREVNGACRAHEQITRRIRTGVDPFGVTRWAIQTVNGACREYEKRCEEYEQVCKAGYKKACKNVVRPFDDIKNELTWLVYQEYMSQLGDESGGPLSDYFTTRLQEFYKTDLRVIRISKGKGLGGEGITDCTHIRFPDLKLVESLQQGRKLQGDDLQWLLHELRHSDQCARVGGRKQYASMWFRQFEGIMTKKFVEWHTQANLLAPLVPGAHSTALIAAIVHDLQNEGANRIHDAMPMEADAEDYANSILERAKAKF